MEVITGVYVDLGMEIDSIKTLLYDWVPWFPKRSIPFSRHTSVAAFHNIYKKRPPFGGLEIVQKDKAHISLVHLTLL